MTIDEIRRVIREELGKGQGVDPEFRELVQVETGDSGRPYEGSYQPETYVPAEELEKIGTTEPLSLAKHAGVADLGWDQEVGTPLSKSEKRHADGVEIEKHGNQTWHWYWQGGELVKSTVEDVDLPGGVMHFDGEGNEIAA